MPGGDGSELVALLLLTVALDEIDDGGVDAEVIGKRVEAAGAQLVDFSSSLLVQRFFGHWGISAGGAGEIARNFAGMDNAGSLVPSRLWYPLLAWSDAQLDAQLSSGRSGS